MQYLIDYIEKYGSFDFNEKPFNEVDCVVFSQLIYNEFNGILSIDDELSISEAAAEFYKHNDDKAVSGLIDVANRAARLLTLCSETKRFGEAVMCKYINNINDAIDKQICAANYLLSDRSVLVAFRGTDATVTGFKESAMLAYMFPVPAQIEALHYFQESAMLHPGAVRLCGHSKGGNLAVYAAVNCSNSLQRKIEGVYAFDAPGFPEWFFDGYDYKQIKDRVHVINPRCAIVGRALFMEKEPEIVNSVAKKSRQHSVATWVIDDDAFERVEVYDEDSDKLGAYLNDLVKTIGDEDLEVFYDALEKTAEEMGVYNFYDLKTVDTNLVMIFIDSIQTLNPEQKARLRSLAKKVMTDFAKDYVSGAATKAKTYVKNVTSKLPFRHREEPEAEENTETDGE